MIPRFRFLTAAVAVSAPAMFFASAPALAVGVGDMDSSRYDVIMQKAPFGPPPNKGPTPEEIEAQRLAEEAAAQAVQEEPYIIPPGLDKVKITLLSRFCGIPGVGFVDGESGKEFYLLEGQSFEGFECRAVDMDGRTATLAKGGLEAELPMWVNPATTNRADVSAFGRLGGQTADISQIQTKTDWELERERSEKLKELEEQRERRRKQREEWEERRRRHSEEMAALTPEQRERRMHDINLDIIMNNSGPPLPIELDEEDERRLTEAGFEIPPPEAREGGPPRGGRRGPGGRRRPPPGGAE